jgi:positive regulator of sigma E activity
MKTILSREGRHGGWNRGARCLRGQYGGGAAAGCGAGRWISRSVFMEERGIVLESERGKARVRIERTSQCEGCHGCLMADTGTYMTADVEDTFGVTPGDVVLIDTKAASPLSASALLFGLPLVLMFIGYAAGSAVAALAHAQSSQIFGIGGAGVFFLGAFGLIALINKRISGGREQKSVIVQVLGRG